MVFDHQDEHHSQWAAICSIADKFSMTHETLRRMLLSGVGKSFGHELVVGG